MRETAWGHGNSVGASELTKDLRGQMRRDRRQKLLDMVSKDLDMRDRWMGLRYLRKGYTPIPYTL